MISTEVDLREKIRVINNFPKPGISFKDITPLLQDPVSLTGTLDKLYDVYKGKGITKVCGIESRGFIFGGLLAHKLNAGFIPVRKEGKLPFSTLRKEYDLEYGKDVIEIHTDSVNENDTILIHDDLLATGGTMNAAINLLQEFNPKSICISFIVELTFLNGRSRLDARSENIHSLISY